ncbi:MAG: hypothetical protein ACLU5I_01705 [Alistipes finegoldii]
MNTVSKYLSLVKFAHTIFAMPFAAVGFVYAYATLPAGAHDAAWWLTRAVQVLLCMVFARNTAMGFNRWADRRIDAENPAPRAAKSRRRDSGPACPPLRGGQCPAVHRRA